jgi:hypothetical protein
MMVHVEKVPARLKEVNSKTTAVTAGECLVFLSLLIGAALQKQSGHALWGPSTNRPFNRGHPGFGDYTHGAWDHKPPVGPSWGALSLLHLLITELIGAGRGLATSLSAYKSIRN